MKKNFKSIALIFLLLVFLSFYLINAVFMMNHFIHYSLLFLTKFIPVSFPFQIIGYLLLQYGIINYIPGGEKISVFFLSFISGFPNGAKYIHDLVKEKSISIEMGNRLLLVSHFPNPLFIFGTVFLVLENTILTFKVYLSIIISNIFLLFFLKTEKRKIIIENPKIDGFAKNLYKAIISSSQTIILIYGTSIFFYLILMIFMKYISFTSSNYVLLCGIFDLTKGVLATSIIDNITNRAFFILLFISFGGISIHMQVKSILADTFLSYNYFLLGRILTTSIALILLYFFTH